MSAKQHREFYPGRSLSVLVLFLAISALVLTPAFPTSAAGGLSLSSQEDETVWAIYRDKFHLYGLAVPEDWSIQPTPGAGVMSAATFFNPIWRDADFGEGEIPEGGIKIDIGVISSQMGDSREEMIYKVFDNITNQVDAIVNLGGGSGDPVKVLISSKQPPYTKDIPVIVYNMPSGDYLFIQVYPTQAWETYVVKAMVNSLVLSEKEEVVLPAPAPAKIIQAFWVGGQGRLRSVAVENLAVQWGGRSPWSDPTSFGLPGSGALQVQSDFIYQKTLYQSIWRGNQGWLRSVPIVGQEPDYARASAWAGPILLSGLPGSGDIQAAENFTIGDRLYQFFWRNNQSWERTVPIVNGVVQYGQAGAWSGPVSANDYPGAGAVVAIAYYPLGNFQLHQSLWRGTESWTRTVAIQNGLPQWPLATPWAGPVPFSSALPGGGVPQTHVVLPMP